MRSETILSLIVKQAVDVVDCLLNTPAFLPLEKKPHVYLDMRLAGLLSRSECCCGEDRILFLLINVDSQLYAIITILLLLQPAQYVSGNFLPILRSDRLCFRACGIMHPSCCRPIDWNAEEIASSFQNTGRQQHGCIIPHAVKHSLSLLRMGKKLPETC